MEKKASIPHTIRLFGKGIRILFKTSGLYAILIVALNIISGLIAPLNSIAYQNLIDCLVNMVEAGDGYHQEFSSL